MLLLIDGYNLLNTSDVFPRRESVLPAPGGGERGKGPTALAAAREALLDFLARALERKLRSRTTIVFDATMAPPGLPREMEWQAITVLFAPRKQSADDLLEELIAAAADPRHLLVVSSDHRVQRAARQRGAQFIDSEKWYAALVAQRRSTSAESTSDSGKPTPAAENPFPPGYAADVASEDWRPPRRGKGKKS